MTETKRVLPEDILVGQQIRAHRIARGLSQTELANHIGVTFQQVQKYEKGVNRVSAGRLQRIAGLFKVHVAELLSVANPKGAIETSYTILAQTREGYRLAKAFNRLEQQELRMSIVAMIEQIAGPAPE